MEKNHSPKRFGFTLSDLKKRGKTAAELPLQTLGELSEAARQRLEKPHSFVVRLLSALGSLLAI